MSRLLKFAAPADLPVNDPELVREALVEMGFSPDRVSVGPPRALRDYYGASTPRRADIVVARGTYADGVHLHADIGLEIAGDHYALHIDHLDHPFATANASGWEVDQAKFLAKLQASVGVARAARAATTIARNVGAEVRRRTEGGKIVLSVAYPS
jgi:hypothetical protein